MLQAMGIYPTSPPREEEPLKPASSTITQNSNRGEVSQARLFFVVACSSAVLETAP